MDQRAVSPVIESGLRARTSFVGTVRVNHHGTITAIATANGVSFGGVTTGAQGGWGVPTIFQPCTMESLIPFQLDSSGNAFRHRECRESQALAGFGMCRPAVSIPTKCLLPFLMGSDPVNAGRRKRDYLFQVDGSGSGTEGQHRATLAIGCLPHRSLKALVNRENIALGY